MSPRVIDLSVPCSSGTEGVSIKRHDTLPVYLGHECGAYDIALKSHTGTYFETSSHLFRDGRDTDAVPPDDLVLPGLCVTVATQAPCVCAADLERECPGSTEGAALLVNTRGAKDRYFSRDAAVWMAEHGVRLMGSSTPLYDRGFEDPTGFFVDLFKAEIPIIANLTNLDRLPRGGFTLVALPLRIVGVCTVPCRVVAVMTEVQT